MTVTAINPPKPPPDVPVLVPEGKDATDLTMGELDVASVHLHGDVLTCMTEDSGKRYAAFIELAYLWAKRRDSRAKRETYREYTPAEIFHALRMDEDEPEGMPDPTGSGDEPNGSPSP